MASDELQAIRDAWDKTVGEGRDEDATRSLCDEYVASHPDEFTELRDMTQEQCVKALEVFRDAGMSDSEWKVQTWLFHHFEPQNIGGQLESRVRAVPTNG